MRALLTVLALRAGRPVPVRELVDEVWYGDEPPADAVAALQALVGRLRGALGRDRVASTGAATGSTPAPGTWTPAASSGSPPTGPPP